MWVSGQMYGQQQQSSMHALEPLPALLELQALIGWDRIHSATSCVCVTIVCGVVSSCVVSQFFVVSQWVLVQWMA